MINERDYAIEWYKLRLKEQSRVPFPESPRRDARSERERREDYFMLSAFLEKDLTREEFASHAKTGASRKLKRYFKNDWIEPIGIDKITLTETGERWLDANTPAQLSLATNI